MSLNEALCDSQSQPRALVSFAGAGLMKLLEHGFQLIGSDTHAGIADGNIRETVRRVSR